MVDIHFFQATATAIPTLFIAMAFTSRGINSDYDELFGKYGPLEIGFATVFVGACATAEMVSLAVLATNETELNYAIFIGAVIVFQLMVLCAAVVFPPLRKNHPPRMWNRFLIFIAILFMMLFPAGAFLWLMT
ncbi:hypothetical protein [Pseudarthrobacter sp. fls2-241-R2A-168]|uniref:hypothetical protein n=1 Tax=Pseudarthrobacter sp. fls2-241-R2A-168 TaxID=3040304 RepID=UPI0025524445|nr:hypothetical protein [Pseudarthrobacter sp. fls2-241-R2A-168]